MPKVSEEHLEARRAQILAGARRAFATYGYDGVRLNGGVSPWDVDVLHGTTNDPVLTIAKGAIVHLDDLDGGRANIESYVGARGRGAARRAPIGK